MNSIDTSRPFDWLATIDCPFCGCPDYTIWTDGAVVCIECSSTHPGLKVTFDE